MSESKKKNTKYIKCVVEGCESIGERGFVTFPKNNQALKAKWLQVLNLSFVRPGDKICRRHFLESDFGKSKIKQNVVPSQHLVRFASI